jgi:hypothetical protein
MTGGGGRPSHSASPSEVRPAWPPMPKEDSQSVKTTSAEASARFRWAQTGQRAQTKATCCGHPGGGWWPVGSEAANVSDRRVGARLLAGLQNPLPEDPDGDGRCGYESRKLARELKRRHRGGGCTSPNVGSAPSRWWGPEAAKVTEADFSTQVSDPRPATLFLLRL